MQRLPHQLQRVMRTVGKRVAGVRVAAGDALDRESGDDGIARLRWTRSPDSAGGMVRGGRGADKIPVFLVRRGCDADVRMLSPMMSTLCPEAETFSFSQA